VHGKIREAIIDTGLFPSTAVDEDMKRVSPADIPAELRDAYFDMMRCAVKSKMTVDPNYPKLKNTGRLEFLDKL